MTPVSVEDTNSCKHAVDSVGIAQMFTFDGSLNIDEVVGANILRRRALNNLEIA